MNVRNSTLSVLVGSLLVSSMARADIYADIAGTVDFATVVTGIGLVAVALAAVLVARRGAQMLLGFIGNR